MTLFETIYNQYYPVMVHYVDRLLHDPETSAHIADTAFVKFWRKEIAEIHQDNPDREMIYLKWLYTTTKRLCYDYYRKQVSRRKVQVVTDKIPEQLTDPQQEISDHEVSIHLRQAIATLSEECRRVVLLYLEGYKSKDEPLTGINHSTFKNHKARAVKLLREYYNKAS